MIDAIVRLSFVTTWVVTVDIACCVGSMPVRFNPGVD